MDLPQDESGNGNKDSLNTSAGSGDSNPPSGKPHKQLGSTDFLKLLGKEETYYIDKTGLVEALFRCERSQILVTAPRRFGKTVNIAMLTYFFELQVEVEKGKKLSEEDFWEKVKETENYNLFHNHNLSITKNEYLMKRHFGRYPVVCISFKCQDAILCYDEALKFCMIVISEAFQAHEYLTGSTSLRSFDKVICTKWCNEQWDSKNDKAHILSGLKSLVQYICMHFGRKVVLLIDEYDSVITQAMLLVKDVEELTLIIQDCTSLVTNAVKENVKENWVEYAFITGISHIAGIGLSGSNVKPFTFLDDHCFVPYYGLTNEEVKGLLEQTYKLGAQDIKDIENKFNGYCSKGGLQMYNMWSVLEYAGKCNENEATYEWQDTGMIVGLEEAFRFPNIKEMIETELLNGVAVNIGKVRRILHVRDVLALTRLIRINFDPRNAKCLPDLFFSFLLEQGYLSFVDKCPGYVAIPNEQIKGKFREKVTDFNIGIFGVNQIPVNNCREFLQRVCLEDCNYNDFKRFHSYLETVKNMQPLG